jgi:NTE family protein
LSREEAEPAPPRRAIVLAGGGARGAYEAGVLRFLLRDLPARFGVAPRLDVLCGTSVGALTACWLAATADLGPERALRFESVWRSMRSEDLLRLGNGGFPGWTALAFGLLRAALRGGVPALLAPGLGLLDRAPFERLVLRTIPWSRIAKNREAGAFHALSVTATEVGSGRAVVFFECRDGPPRHWTPDPTIVARPTALGPAHALASAAIPLVFPTVSIEGRAYVDGALRLNTPLVPALRFGADRILVVALRPSIAADAAGEGPNGTPADAFDLMGKVLSALLLDHVEADLGRMRFVNDVLRRGERTFGPEYLARLNQTAQSEGAQPLRLVDETVIRPSQDPRALAAEALRRLRAQGRLSALLRLFDRSLERRAEGAELFSYVLFDAEYTAALCDLGYEDARRREEDLARFFADPA